MREDGDGEDEMLETGSLINRSREQEIGLARGYGAGDKWEERSINEVQPEESCRWISRVFLNTRHCKVWSEHVQVEICAGLGATYTMHPTGGFGGPISGLEIHRCALACLPRAWERICRPQGSRDRGLSRPRAKGLVLAWR